MRLENTISAVDYQDYITFEPGKRSGQPCIRRMRLTVYDVFEYLAGGMSIEEVMDDFPELTRDDISAICDFAARVIRRTIWRSLNAIPKPSIYAK